MGQLTDAHATIWTSEEVAPFWAAKTDERERKRAAHWRFTSELLPFGEQDAFTCLNLGAGNGTAEALPSSARATPDR